MQTRQARMNVGIQKKLLIHLIGGNKYLEHFSQLSSDSVKFFFHLHEMIKTPTEHQHTKINAWSHISHSFWAKYCQILTNYLVWLQACKEFKKEIAIISPYFKKKLLYSSCQNNKNIVQILPGLVASTRVLESPQPNK